MTRPDVLIAGAGPSGLVLALWLTKLSVLVRVIDKAAACRAVAVAAYTLDLYCQLDLADSVMARAHTVCVANFWFGGKAVAQVTFGQIGHDLSPYGLLQVFPRDAHEGLLIEKLKELGVSVERSV